MGAACLATVEGDVDDGGNKDVSICARPRDKALRGQPHSGWAGRYDGDVRDCRERLGRAAGNPIGEDADRLLQDRLHGCEGAASGEVSTKL